MKDKQKVMEVTPADDPNAVADEEEKWVPSDIYF